MSRRGFLRRTAATVGGAFLFTIFGNKLWASSPCARQMLPIPPGRSGCTYRLGGIVCCPKGGASTCGPCSPNCATPQPAGTTCYCFEPACMQTLVCDACSSDCIQATCVVCNWGICSCFSISAA